jgi:hypothetical protein
MMKVIDISGNPAAPCRRLSGTPENLLHPCDKLSGAPENLLHPCDKLSGVPENPLQPCMKLSGERKPYYEVFRNYGYFMFGLN